MPFPTHFNEDPLKFCGGIPLVRKRGKGGTTQSICSEEKIFPVSKKISRGASGPYPPDMAQSVKKIFLIEVNRNFGGYLTIEDGWLVG